MSEESSLFAAVLARPDDDAPRLVFADFLSGKGDPRGEFITLQCRLAASTDDEARRKLRIAENKLLKEHAATWGAGLVAIAPSATGRPAKISFHRGFLEEVDLAIHALDDLAPYFEEAPLLRRLRIDAPMWVGQPLTPPSLEGRLSSPLLQKVRSLELRINAAGDAAVIELAQSQFTSLESLQIQASSWPVPDMELYTGSPDQHLFTAAGALALSKSKVLTKLKHLDVALNSIGSAGVIALLDGPWKLEHLDVSANGLDDAALIALASSPGSASLKHLALGGGVFTPKALETFAKSKHLNALTTLQFDNATLGPKGLAAFLGALKLPKLTALGLSATGLGDEGAKIIAKSKAIAQLTSLELGENKITQDGVFALAESPQLTKLTRLLINDAWLGKKAVVERLAESETLANCRIYLKGSLIGRATVAKEKAAKTKPEKPKTKKQKK